MRRFMLLMLFPACLLGCRDRTPIVVNPQQPVVVQQRPVVVAQPDAVTRDVYLTGMREKLDEFDRQLATWNQAKERSKSVEMTTALGELKQRRDTFAQEIQRLATNSEVSWTRTKEMCDRAYVATTEAFNRLSTRF